MQILGPTPDLLKQKGVTTPHLGINKSSRWFWCTPPLLNHWQMKSPDTCLALKCLLFTYSLRFISHPHQSQLSCRIIYPHVAWQMGAGVGDGADPALKPNCTCLFGLLFLFPPTLTVWPNVPSMFVFSFFLHLFTCQGVVSIDHFMHTWVATHFTVEIYIHNLMESKTMNYLFSLNMFYLTTSSNMILLQHSWATISLQCNQKIIKALCGKTGFNN